MDTRDPGAESLLVGCLIAYHETAGPIAWRLGLRPHHFTSLYMGKLYERCLKLPAGTAAWMACDAERDFILIKQLVRLWGAYEDEAEAANEAAWQEWHKRGLYGFKPCPYATCDRWAERLATRIVTLARVRGKLAEAATIANGTKAGTCQGGVPLV